MKPQRRNIGRERMLAPLLVIILGVVAYCNSLSGPFIFDDKAAIVQNPQIRSMVPFKIAAVQPTTIAGRPVLIFTFAVNYRVGHMRVENYHLTNLVIHLGCALLIYFIARRTLLCTSALGVGFCRTATWLAAAIASIWVVHPLNTQSVTYLAQRAESLASLFLLISIYGVIRAAAERRWWGVVAVVACALGMGTKEIAAATPILAILYDRTFLAGNFERALQLRWKIYFGMLCGLVLIGISLHTGLRGTMVGFGLGISALDYARTELNVIAHYIVLAFWPRNLVIDYYDWPIARHWSDVSWGGWLVLAGAIGSLAALKFKPWLGFLGVFFLAILAPTSSFLPIVEEAAAEQRIYLPLAAIVTLVVVIVWFTLAKWKAGRWLAGVACVAAVVALTAATIARNQQYGSDIDIWTDATAKRANNTRAHVNLGEAWAQASIEFPPGSSEARQAAEQAAAQFRIVMALEPRVSHAIFGLGQSLVHLGDPASAESVYTEQLPKHPEIAADLHVERGTLRAQRADWPEAKQDFEAAIGIQPNDLEAHYYLALVDQQLGDLDAAKRELARVVAASPDYKDAAMRLQELGGAK
jgi:tetratricopeptide (TPR) repeat protein